MIMLFGCIAGCPGNQQGKDSERTIPLESTYATTGQKNVQTIRSDLEATYGKDLDKIYEKVSDTSLSHIFIVRGEDLNQAIKATRRAFTSSQRGDRVIESDDNSAAAQCWVVAYLGSGSSTPPAWEVRWVKVKGQIVQLAVSEPKRKIASADWHTYLVWVPLGKLEPDTYSLELIDAEKMEVTLMRRVTVQDNK
jgi:hypothetical protein